MIKYIKSTLFMLVCTMTAVISGCSKFDEYKDRFVKDGPISYPGIVDSVKVLSGKNRAILSGLFVADPKLTKYRVFWNSHTDSLEGAIKLSGGIDTFKAIIDDLPEGAITFEIRTYDIDGNKSIPVFASGIVYGDIYQNSLNPRAIISTEVQADNSLQISWANVGASGAGLVSMQVKYNDLSGQSHDTSLSPILTDFVTILPDFKAGTSFSYRSAFLPDTTAIDTFFTPYQEWYVKEDVTSTYLTNYQQIFEKLPSTDSRWAVPAGWDVNDAVKNHNGYGGWASDNNTVLVMEGGWPWGSSPIVNGKMSQTVTLPAGDYTFQVTVQEGNASNAFMVAAAGSALPDTDNLASALAYSSWNNGSISFSLTQEQEVTIGFVANVGSDNTGEYFRVNRVQLFH